MSRLDDIPSNMGSILSNLLSLEFTLRLFLHEILDPPETSTGTSFKPMTWVVGDVVPENYLTNYDTLNELIRKVNSELKTRGVAESIDESIVELRDALAHGRILSRWEQGPYRILKFSKPINGKAQVTLSVDMTPEWFSQQIKNT